MISLDVHVFDTSQLRYTHDNLRWLSSLVSHFSLSSCSFFSFIIESTASICLKIDVHTHTHIYIDYHSSRRRRRSRGMRWEESIFSVLLLLLLSSVTNHRGARTAFSPSSDEKIASREERERESFVILIDQSSPLFYLADHTWHNQIVLVSLDICISLISSRCHIESYRSTQASMCTENIRCRHPSANCIFIISNFSLPLSRQFLLLENANCSLALSPLVSRQHALLSTSSYPSLVTQLVWISTSALTFSLLYCRCVLSPGHMCSTKDDFWSFLLFSTLVEDNSAGLLSFSFVRSCFTNAIN